MKKWYFVIDVEKCEDCNNCLLACKDEHVDNDWTGYTLPQPRHGHRWINVSRIERGQFPIVDVAYRPTPCMHCEEAPCIEASKGAAYKRPDGIVIIDAQKAKGNKDLVESCPYKSIWWNEEESVPQKCTLCAHLLDDGWKVPRCVHSCPTGALRVEYVEDAQMNAIIVSEKLEVLNPELKTRPNVFYKNLYRFNKCFIAGSVETSKDGIVDCAEGAKVTLLQGEKLLGECLTDNYGEFKFDALTENSGIYTLNFEFKGTKKTMQVDLKTSTNVGDIRI